MWPLPLEAQRRCRLEGQCEEEIERATFGGFGEDRTGHAPETEIHLQGAVGRADRGDPAPQIVPAMRNRERHRRAAGVDLVAGIVRRVEYLMRVAPERADEPPAPNVQL